MKSLIHYIKVYLIRFKFSFKIFTNSLLNFFIGTFAYMIMQIGGILFISIIFQQIPQINGFNFYQMLAIYSFAQITKGLDHFYSDYLWFFASNGVIRGTYDKYLTRPLNPIFQILIEKVQFDAIGEILIGILLFSHSIRSLKISIDIFFILKLIFFIICGCIVYTCIKIIGTAFAFFLKRSFNLVRALYSMSEFAKYPLTIYPKFIRILLTYVIAYSLTGYYPVKYLIIENLNFFILLKFILVILFLIYITKFIWKEGEKRYESSGS